MLMEQENKKQNSVSMALSDYLICVGLTMKKIFRVSDLGICIVDAEPDSKTHEQVRGPSE